MNKKLITILIILGFVVGCKKYEETYPETLQINLGKTSELTAIKLVKQENNIVTAVFSTTPGAKYSIQIIPFGSETPILKEGFTANNTEASRIFDLSNLPKKDYDLIFIDISGKEVKYPIIIK
jgi:hypothetical protein